MGRAVGSRLPILNHIKTKNPDKTFAQQKRGSSALEIPAWSPTAVLIELKGA